MGERKPQPHDALTVFDVMALLDLGRLDALKVMRKHLGGWTVNGVWYVARKDVDAYRNGDRT